MGSERVRVNRAGSDPRGSGWDPTGSNQTGQDWTRTDPIELGRMRQNRREWGQTQRIPVLRLGFGVIPEPLQMEAAGLGSWGGLAALPVEQGSKSHCDPPDRADTGWILPVPLLPRSGVHPGRACVPQASIGTSPVPEVVLHINVLKSARGTWFSLAPLLWVPVAWHLPFIYIYMYLCIYTSRGINTFL